MKLYSDFGSFRSIGYKLGAVLVLSSGFAAYAYAAKNPEMTEELYSRGFYPRIIKNWAAVTAFADFSIAEIAVMALAVCVVVRIVRTLFWILRERSLYGKLYYTADILASGALTAVLICFLFIATWGLNYNRLPFADTSGLDVKPVSVSMLEEACARLAAEANALRGKVREGDGGAMALSVSLRNTFDRARDGFAAAAAEFETLGDVAPTRPKPVFLSKLMSNAGITGIYFPITSEANINKDVTEAELPFTMCHELAHQLGYAREDEANFIAWVACSHSPYEDYRYSGAVLALRHMLRSLYAHDRVAWARIRDMMSPEVKHDFEAIDAYWRSFQSPVTELSTTINDTYLKINNQNDGVQSYGRMVDLVIAYMGIESLPEDLPTQTKSFAEPEK